MNRERLKILASLKIQTGVGFYDEQNPDPPESEISMQSNVRFKIVDLVQSMRVFALVLLGFSAPAISFELSEASCSNQGIATGTEQRVLGVGAVLSEKLGESPDSIIRITVNKYTPWKDLSFEPDPTRLGCFRNWFTRFHLRYLALRQGKEGAEYLCEVSLEGQMYTDVLQSAGGNTGKVRVNSEVCTHLPTQIQSARALCTERAQGVGCRPIKETPTYPDLFDNCQCKPFDQFVIYDDLQEQYEDFFNPGRFEERPSHVGPFESVIENSFDDLKEYRSAFGIDIF